LHYCATLACVFFVFRTILPYNLGLFVPSCHVSCCLWADKWWW